MMHRTFPLISVAALTALLSACQSPANSPVPPVSGDSSHRQVAGASARPDYGDFHGIVERIPEGRTGTWVIGGRPVQVTAGTKLDEEDGPLAVGACADVDCEGNGVKEIESGPRHKCGR